MQSEWERYRERIRGIRDALLRGEGEDDDPEMLTVGRLLVTDPEALSSLSYEDGAVVTARHEQGREAHFRQSLSASSGDHPGLPKTTDRPAKSNAPETNHKRCRLPRYQILNHILSW